MDSAKAKIDPPKKDIKNIKNLIYQCLFFEKASRLATKN
jgi:hypothetical protein